MAGEEIEPARLLEAARAAAAGADALVCEGVGGLLVPLAGRVVSLCDRKSTGPIWSATSRSTSATRW